MEIPSLGQWANIIERTLTNSVGRTTWSCIAVITEFGLTLDMCAGTVVLFD